MKTAWPRIGDRVRTTGGLSRMGGVMVVLGWALMQSAFAPPWWEGSHAARVRAVAFSPDGSAIASASEDATVKLWSAGGRLLQTLSFHPTPATAVAFSPDSRRLAVGTYRGEVELFQASKGWDSESTPVRESAHRNSVGQILTVAFSADGKWFATGGAEGSNVVRQVEGGAWVAQLAGYSGGTPAANTGLAFSRDGLLASAGRDGTRRVWNAGWNDVWTLAGQDADVPSAVAFSPDGSRLADARSDGTIRLFAAGTGEAAGSFSGHSNVVPALAFSPDGTRLASGGHDHTVRLWEVSSGVCRAVLSGHEGAVTSVAFAPDGATLVSGSADKTVRLWSCADGNEVRRLGGRGNVRGVAMASDGAQVAGYGDGNKIEIRSLVDGTVRRSLVAQSDWLTTVCFSPDATLLACGGGPADGSLQVWRVQDGVRLRRWAAHPNGVTSAAFSPDGRRVAAGGDASDRTIQLYNLADDPPALILPGHTHGVTALAFSPAGDFLVSGGRRLDATLKVWRLTDGALSRTLSGHAGNIEALAISPDGRFLASGSSGNAPLRVWDLTEGTGRTLPTTRRWVPSVAFSPDGTVLAVASGEAVEFWDPLSGQLRKTVTQDAIRATSLVFSPNGNWILIGREDATVGVVANPVNPTGQPPLRLGRVSVDTVGGLVLSALGQGWTTYRIEASSDFASWRFVTNAVSATGELQVREVPPETEDRQFYRALTPP